MFAHRKGSKNPRNELHFQRQSKWLIKNTKKTQRTRTKVLYLIKRSLRNEEITRYVGGGKARNLQKNRLFLFLGLTHNQIFRRRPTGNFKLGRPNYDSKTWVNRQYLGNIFETDSRLNRPDKWLIIKAWETVWRNRNFEGFAKEETVRNHWRPIITGQHQQT